MNQVVIIILDGGSPPVSGTNSGSDVGGSTPFPE